jgi:hypothetical protein
MFQSISKRLRITPSGVIATLALVFAMSGGAYAASKYLITSTKQISPKVLKALKGKPGSNGVAGGTGSAGPAGPQGPGGPAGPAGKGEKGEPGTSGTTGANGKNVALTNITNAGLEGKCVGVGGTRAEVEGEAASRKYVCNGKNGAIQPGETLPKGASETGTWAFFTHTEGIIFEPISFPIPLAAALGGEHLFYVPISIQNGEIGAGTHEFCEGKAGTELAECEAEATHIAAECPGSYESPEAPEGNLCVYEAHSLGAAAKSLGVSGSTKAGAIASFEGPSTVNIESGTWAVTAE